PIVAERGQVRLPYKVSWPDLRLAFRTNAQPQPARPHFANDVQAVKHLLVHQPCSSSASSQSSSSDSFRPRKSPVLGWAERKLTRSPRTPRPRFSSCPSSIKSSMARWRVLLARLD